MELWNDWRKHYESLDIDPEQICKDGILDTEAWKTANPKIVFVLRESNDYPGDLADLLCDGPRYQTWHAISRWAGGLLKGFPRFEEVDDYAKKKEALHMVAALNLKKPTGGSGADMSVVSAYAFQDRALLLEQFRQISPDVVVACGTFDLLVWLLELVVKPDKSGQRPVYDAKRKAWVIPFRHPTRADSLKSYAQLEKVARQEPALWGLLGQRQ